MQIRLSIPHVHMQFLVMLGFAIALSSNVRADDYGCTVLLCLANPNGPQAVAECVDPINRLWDDLDHLRPFPTCDMGGSAYARQGRSYYDECPSGTEALSNGAIAVQSAEFSQHIPAVLNGQTTYTGIGTGDGLMPGAGHIFAPLPSKVCVGNEVGHTSIRGGPRNSFVSVGVYDQVTVLDPAKNARYIDVFVDNTQYRRVRW